MPELGEELETLIRAIVRDEFQKLEPQSMPLPPVLAYSERDACRILGISQGTARRLRRQRLLRFSRVGRRAVYLPEHIEEFLKQHERGGKPRR